MIQHFSSCSCVHVCLIEAVEIQPTFRSKHWYLLNYDFLVGLLFGPEDWGGGGHAPLKLIITTAVRTEINST
jgi:hypothetical protein